MLYILTLLILNEIYNYRDYNKDTFYQEGLPTTQSFKDMLKDTDYDYGQGEPHKGTYSVQDKLHLFDYPELQLYTIPVGYDKQLEGSMSCMGKEKILDTINQQDKLKLQRLYMNQLYNFYGRKNIDFDELDSLNDEVFNPIERNESLKNLKCPTTCHLIADEEVCRKALHVPVFEDKTDFTDYTKEIEACNDKKENECTKDNACYWDNDFQDCYYDKRRCFYEQSDDKKNPQCYTRCEFLTLPTEHGENDSQKTTRIARSKSICESASSYTNHSEKHCKWDDNENKCKTTKKSCNKYLTERECDSDSNCRVDNNSCTEK
tara:strand:+ start:3084 stop:4040 length:957 start_codon:yes stop_codon:yes gene_type:complete